jgi:monoamine oxidase
VVIALHRCIFLNSNSSTLGRSCLILEARNRVGGRTLTSDVLGGIPVDLGASWIHHSCIQSNPLTQAACATRTPIGVPNGGSDIWLSRDGSTPILKEDFEAARVALQKFEQVRNQFTDQHANKHHTQSPFDNIQWIDYCRALGTAPQAAKNSTSDQIDVTKFYDSHSAAHCGAASDSTVDSVLSEHISTPEVPAALSSLTPTGAGILAALHNDVEQYEGTPLNRLSAAHGGAEVPGVPDCNMVVASGYGALIQRLAADAKLQVELDTVVDSVITRLDGVIVHARKLTPEQRAPTAHGSSIHPIEQPLTIAAATTATSSSTIGTPVTYHARYCIVTVPLGVLQRNLIHFDPPLPQWKRKAIDELGFGLLNKVALQFSHPWWEDELSASTTPATAATTAASSSTVDPSFVPESKTNAINILQNADETPLWIVSLSRPLNAAREMHISSTLSGNNIDSAWNKLMQNSRPLQPSVQCQEEYDQTETRDESHAVKSSIIPATVGTTVSIPPSSASPLSPSHERALSHMTSLSSGQAIDPSLRITVNFHPDRIVMRASSVAAATDGITSSTDEIEPLLLLESLARDKAYHSQFVTGISNGSYSPQPGGSRWEWESSIFSGAYDLSNGIERPIYGGLNFRKKLCGAVPRFGSSHLRLSPFVLNRTSFCYPDSTFHPKHFGVSSAIQSLIDYAVNDTKNVDELDDYIEAHVHGGVDFTRGDVEAIVLDPSYRGTNIEIAAMKLSQYCNIEWLDQPLETGEDKKITTAGSSTHNHHEGERFLLSSSEYIQLDSTYRGIEYLQLGKEIADTYGGGFLTPNILGKAAHDKKYDTQTLKKIWHYLARFGRRTDKCHSHADGAITAASASTDGVSSNSNAVPNSTGSVHILVSYTSCFNSGPLGNYNTSLMESRSDSEIINTLMKKLRRAFQRGEENEIISDKELQGKLIHKARVHIVDFVVEREEIPSLNSSATPLSIPNSYHRSSPIWESNIQGTPARIVPSPIGYAISRWGLEPYSYGAYAHYRPGTGPETAAVLGKPVRIKQRITDTAAVEYECVEETDDISINSSTTTSLSDTNVCDATISRSSSIRLLFAGEATLGVTLGCVDSAWMSGMREALRIKQLCQQEKQ